MIERLSLLETGWLVHRLRRLRFRWAARRAERPVKVKPREFARPVLLVVKDGVSAFCPDCYAKLVAYRGDGGAQVAACPSWHYCLILISGRDVRAHEALVAALPNARAMPRALVDTAAALRHDFPAWEGPGGLEEEVGGDPGRGKAGSSAG